MSGFEFLTLINSIINIGIVGYFLIRLYFKFVKRSTLQMFEDALGVLARLDKHEDFKRVEISRLNYLILPYDPELDKKIRKSLAGIISTE